MSAPSLAPDQDRRLKAIETALYDLQRQRTAEPSSLDNCPTGTVVASLSPRAWAGWLPMQGQVITTTNYPALHAYLLSRGLSTTLPDSRDIFWVGAGNLYSVTSTGGSANAVVVSHTHTTGHASTAAEAAGHGAPVTGSFQDRVRVNRSGGAGTGDVSDSTGASGTNANLPPYRGIYWMIRT